MLADDLRQHRYVQQGSRTAEVWADNSKVKCPYLHFAKILPHFIHFQQHWTRSQRCKPVFSCAAEIWLVTSSGWERPSWSLWKRAPAGNVHTSGENWPCIQPSHSLHSSALLTLHSQTFLTLNLARTFVFIVQARIAAPFFVWGLV